VAFVALGVLTIPCLVVVHTAIGYFRVTAWRRTGNLGASGTAHAAIDPLRHAVALL
jgi:membrane protease YdiL (CAAX protease family)